MRRGGGKRAAGRIRGLATFGGMCGTGKVQRGGVIGSVSMMGTTGTTGTTGMTWASGPWGMSGASKQAGLAG